MHSCCCFRGKLCTCYCALLTSPGIDARSVILSHGEAETLCVHWVTCPQATDWLDGFLARRMGLQSVLGSYLDPLGDKVLICSVVGALAYKGLVPTWVAVVVVGRDVALVAGTLLHRWHTLGWRRVTLQEFCKTQALPAARGAGADKQPCGSLDRASRQAAGRNAYIDTGVPLMRPLMISKANTVLQLSLVAGCLGQAWVAWPDPNSLHLLELATASTTAASCLAYAHQHFSRGRH